MRVHAIMHVGVEGPGRIAEWAESRGHTITTSLALTEEYPDLADVGLICVMGGPMDADDHVRSPWLGAEKAWLREALAEEVPMLGVCLGAQILAEVIGGRVVRNPIKEVGWFDVELTEAGRSSALFTEWPRTAVVGQWHGDTFELPAGVAASVTSVATRNQAFDYEGRVAGVQFHLEWDAPLVAELVTAFPEDLSVPGPFVQTPAELVDGAHAHAEQCGTMLWKVLDALTERR